MKFMLCFFCQYCTAISRKGRALSKGKTKFCYKLSSLVYMLPNTYNMLTPLYWLNFWMIIAFFISSFVEMAKLVPLSAPPILILCIFSIWSDTPVEYSYDIHITKSFVCFCSRRGRLEHESNSYGEDSDLEVKGLWVNFQLILSVLLPQPLLMVCMGGAIYTIYHPQKSHEFCSYCQVKLWMLHCTS